MKVSAKETKVKVNAWKSIPPQHKRDEGSVVVDGCCGRQGMEGTIERLEASLRGGEDVHGTWLNPLP